MRSSLVGVALLSLFVTAIPCAAQSDCLKRTIPVGVYTKDGSTVPNVTAVNFAGSYQNKPVAVKSVGLPENLPRMILLINTHGIEAWRDTAINFAEGVVSRLPSEVEVGLNTFDRDTTWRVYATKDRVRLMNRLEDLRSRVPAKGKIEISAALAEGLQMMNGPRIGDTVFAITDTIYTVSMEARNGNDSDEKAIEGNLQSAGVRVFVLRPPTQNELRSSAPPESAEPIRPNTRSINLDEIPYSNLLDRLVKVTGGTLLKIDYTGFLAPAMVALADKHGNPTRFGQDLSQQVRQFTDFFQMNIELPESVEKPKDWNLELTGLSKSQRENLVLTYPARLYPCR
jgi:hypothetical protein